MDARQIERLATVEAEVQHLKTWRGQAEEHMEATDKRLTKWDLQKAWALGAMFMWAFLTGGGTVSLEHLLQVLK